MAAMPCCIKAFVSLALQCAATRARSTCLGAIMPLEPRLRTLVEPPPSFRRVSSIAAHRTPLWDSVEH
jgi:hypothetical protein